MKESEIEKLINENTFDKLKNIGDCVCYKINKPCHDMPEDELVCLEESCMCFNYDTSNISRYWNRSTKESTKNPNFDPTKPEGGCKIFNPLGGGKWLAKPEGGKIWGCTDCTYPHQKNNILEYLKSKQNNLKI
ncbi:MAG: cysteine-rich small domain-containing protein [Candidatus Nanoarchaeia archaeon]|nr:cysteine-rich small domain-containing protein [Candidatus Nanoarchaeia archaeon]